MPLPDSVAEVTYLAAKNEHQILTLPYPGPDLHFSFPSRITSSNVSKFLSKLPQTTILISTASVRLTSSVLATAPDLRLIVTRGTGTDYIDLEACRERGICVCNTPSQNAVSVAEHAFTLLGAVKAKVVELDGMVRAGKWEGISETTKLWKNGPPRTNAEEVLGIVGYGEVGRRVASIAKALGMTVIVAEHNDAASIRPDRKSFDEVLRCSTVVVLCCPLSASTRDLISTSELQSMKSDAIHINVSRGGVVNESAQVQALKDGSIGGAATDVFAKEPSRTSDDSPLLERGVPNLVLSPHVAWYSKATVDGTAKSVEETVEAWVGGGPKNVIVEGRSDEQSVPTSRAGQPQERYDERTTT